MRAESRWAMGALCIIFAVGCGGPGQTASSSAEGRSAEELPAGVEILWDEWGVPHLFAAGPQELFYAFGWAQARDHGDLVLRLYGRARGRAAEYWGEEELESDRWVWTMGIPERAERWLAAQTPAFRGYVEAFARGLSDYASQHPEAIDDEVEVVLPITAADVMAHNQRLIQFTFIVDPRSADRFAQQFEDDGSQPGSNAWAIGPSRSASGNAILVANPHLPWSDLFLWYEVQLTSPEIDAYGAALVGSPFLGIGFNDHLAWSHTVNTHDGDDLYELTLNDGGYLFDGETRAFETEERSLAVKAEDGALREERLTTKRSVHGPLIAEAGDRALALRVVGLEAAQAFEQYWAMARATDLEEFRAAQSRMQMPMFTTIYADRDGRIVHHFGGEVPRRSSGDWQTWQRPVPGDSSEWLWTETHAYDELPTVVDPPSGWLQNANDPPWTTTFPPALAADDYPPYMAPRFMHLRAQRSARMLAEDESVTFDEAVAYKLSTRMELADRILDDLEVAVGEHGGEEARRAMAVLTAWDRAADAESRGAVLFVAFVDRLEESGGFAGEWSESDPRETPDGLADPAAAVAALEEVAAEVEAEHGSIDVPWGDVYRLVQGERELPANGGPGSLGIFRVVNYAPAADGHRHAYGGDSWVAVIELSDPPRAEALLTYGNSSQPGSPHNGDQLELFAQKKLRPVWRERAEIEDHLEERVQLALP